MPTPRMHGGAPLAQIPLTLPAFRGVNRQSVGAILPPEWATRLQNTVLDRNNRISSRFGWLKATTTPASSDFVQMVEYDNAGSKELVATVDDNTIVKSTDDGQTWSVITGTATVTDPNMDLVIFNDVLLGFQSSGVVITYSGTTFSNLGATNEPGADIAIAAFGRVYAKDSATVIKYCALLDETTWTGAGTGTFDLTSIWQEQDEITGLANFNNRLVVFSKRNIVFFDDNTGSVLGLDPTQARVVDIVPGVGCIARDSIVNVKGDVWFLDDTGYHSLGRLVLQESNPLQNLSENVQDELTLYASAGALTQIRAVYSPKDRFVLLCFPRGDTTETGVAFCFDTRSPMEDGNYRCTGIWNQFVPTTPVVREDLTLFTARTGNAGEVGQYAGYRDDGSPYIMEYESAWMDLSSAEYKMLKRINLLALNEIEQVVTMKWSFDFEDRAFRTAQLTLPGQATVAEWNIAEWNLAEWGGGFRINEKPVAGSGYGEYIKVGLTAQIDGGGLSVQQLALYSRIGRTK